MGLFDFLKSDLPPPLYKHGEPGAEYLLPLPSATDPSIHTGNSRRAIRRRAEDERKGREWMAWEDEQNKKWFPGQDIPVWFFPVGGRGRGDPAGDPAGNSMGNSGGHGQPPLMSQGGGRGMQSVRGGSRGMHQSGLDQASFGLGDPAMFGGGRGSAARSSRGYGRGVPRGYFGDMGGMSGGRGGMSNARGGMGGPVGMFGGRGQ